MKTSRIRVYGRVQRVGYRRYILDLAQELNLSGYVENLKDGSVLIFVQGEENRIKEFISKLRNPPIPALVRNINIEEAQSEPTYEYFTIKPGELWEEFNEGLGAMQSIFTEYWNEFRDYRGEFKDYRREFREFRQEFKEFRQEFEEFARSTDENFKLLMDRYGEISEKLTVILDTLIKESKETREILLENIKLLREAIEKLGEKTS